MDIRTTSLGELQNLSFADRFGIWLSTRRVARIIGSFDGKAIGDFGSGYEAHATRRFIRSARHAVVIDVSLSDGLKELPNVTTIEGFLPIAMVGIESDSLDVTLCISVLEHLMKPEVMLAELFRVTVPGGTCIVNVPTWRGKRLLEFSAFRLRLSPAAEMNDHKNYYDPRDLWPLLVRAGFLPMDINCKRYKFGCNTIAVCKKPRSAGTK